MTYSVLRFFQGALVTISYPSFYFYFAERFAPEWRSISMTICDLIGALTEMTLRVVSSIFKESEF